MKNQVADNFYCQWGTCFKKTHQLSQVFSADIYLIIHHFDQIVVYKFNENAAWLSSEAEMIDDQSWVNHSAVTHCINY